jgi:cytochrome c556
VGQIIQESFMTRVKHIVSSSFLGLTVPAILIVSLCLTNNARADSHEDSGPQVEYRQTLMEIIGGNMGAMGVIMKNRLALPGHIAVHAGQMAEMARLIAPAFKNNVESNATDAEPEIWKDWAKFEASIDDFETAARNLQAAAEGADPAAVGPAMKALGKSCGGCHKPFRKPKEESFKNKARNSGRD